MFQHKTVAALSPNFDAAAEVVRSLEADGFTKDHLSIVTGKPGENTAVRLDVIEHPADINAEKTDDAVTKGGVGGLVGGTAGFLAGIRLIAIPGLGPVLAGGWLLSTATGVSFVMAGGLAASLVHAGHLDHYTAFYTGLGPVLIGSWLVTTAIGFAFGMAGGFASTASIDLIEPDHLR